MADTLREDFIRQAALRHLAQRHYAECGKGQSYVNPDEFNIVKQRVEALLAFYLRPNQAYVVTLEARYGSTLIPAEAEPKPHAWSDNWWIHIGVAAAMLLGVAIYFQAHFLVVTACGLLGVFAGFNLLYPEVLRLDFRAKPSIPVIAQLAQFPANERWLAIGFDALPDAEQRRVVLDYCRRMGFGLLEVDEEGLARELFWPRPYLDPNRKDYLTLYPQGAEIRAWLHQRTQEATGGYQLTPAMRRARVVQYGVLAGIAVGVGVLALLLFTGPDDQAPLVEVEQPVETTPLPTAPAEPEPAQEEDDGWETIPSDDYQSPFGTEAHTETEGPFAIVDGDAEEVFYLIADSFWETEADAAKRANELRYIGIYESTYVRMRDFNSYITKPLYAVLFAPPQREYERSLSILDDGYSQVEESQVQMHQPRVFPATVKN